MAAAEPPDEPPATRSSAHGLCTGSLRHRRRSAERELMEVQFAQQDGASVLQPDDHVRIGGRHAALKTPLAAVVSTPAVSMLSLSAIGTPWSGPRRLPRLISASSSRALASACSGVTVMNALIAGSSRSIRARQARVVPRETRRDGEQGRTPPSASASPGRATAPQSAARAMPPLSDP